MTELSSLGWDRSDEPPHGAVLARVARVDRGRLTVLTAEGERRVVPSKAVHDAELGGPAVGDWVVLRGELATEILPRRSAFVRTVAGRTSAAQVVAANVDVVLVVDSITGEGLAGVAARLGPGRTAAMVGPSGVGKSSMANALAGRTVAG